jgi:hypothetical protein
MEFYIMVRKFLSSVIISIFVSTGVFASDKQFETISFQLDVNLVGSDVVDEFRYDLRELVDRQNARSTGNLALYDAPSGHTPHVTLEVFRKGQEGASFTREETRSLFQHELVRCASLLRTDYNGLLFDNLNPVMILQMRKPDGDRYTRHLRNEQEIDSLIYEDILYSLTIALEAHHPDILPCSEVLRNNLVRGGLVVNKDHENQLVHISILKLFPILKDKLELYQKNGLFSLNESLHPAPFIGDSIGYLRSYLEGSFEILREFKKPLTCSSLSLNAMAVKALPTARNPRLVGERKSELNYDTGCYPLSSACRIDFIRKFEDEMNKDGARGEGKQFTPKLVHIYKHVEALKEGGSSVIHVAPSNSLRVHAAHQAPSPSLCVPQPRNVSANEEMLQMQNDRIDNNLRLINERRAFIKVREDKIDTQREQIRKFPNSETKQRLAKERLAAYQEEIDGANGKVAEYEGYINEAEEIIRSLK